MRYLSAQEFDALCSQDQVKIIKTMKDKRLKILETVDGRIIKIMHAKKSALAKYKNKKAALRFCRNASLLVQQNINAPHISAAFYCPEKNNCVVIYKKMPGESFRSLAKNDPQILAEIAALLAKLHQKGIFFRSLHIDNVLRTPNDFALIDIAEVNFSKKPLDFFSRYRNLRHMFLIKQDKLLWQQFGLEKFLQLYYQHASMPRWSQWMIKKMILYKCN